MLVSETDAFARPRPWRAAALLAAIAGGVAVAVWQPSIPQDPAYHGFADRRAWLGIPNVADVLTSVPFVLVGLYGLLRVRVLARDVFAGAYRVFAATIALTGCGSVWYHLSPGTATLVWDRLPMAAAFMSLAALVAADRISERIARGALWPLVCAGIASVLYWYWSETRGAGDLRPYALVQFLPVLLLPITLVLFRGRALAAGWLWATLALFVLAKIAEHFDGRIFHLTGFISGHSVKHLLAATAALCVLWSAPRRSPRAR